jgi:hypothetical protein
MTAATYQPTGTLTAEAPAAVKAPFTPKRPKRDKPTEEWGKFMGRLFRAFARRAAAEDPWVVADMLRSQAELAGMIDTAVFSLIKRGYSYAEIAAELSRTGHVMTKQNVSQRWGAKYRALTDAQREQVPA